MSNPIRDTAEYQRLKDSKERTADWKKWGPYVSDRAWGTVREDYSPDGSAWEYFPHDHARSRVYRWNEDGLGGLCNRYQNICLALAFWNEKDPIIKERLFGLTGNEGNHGEDVKEYYFYLDSTPTHSYMKMLYKYPQVAFPYGQLVSENRQRGRNDPEFELVDALREAWQQARYFDIFIEYAKAGQEDILCRVTAHNRGPAPAPHPKQPHRRYRNTWSWGYGRPKPRLQAINPNTIRTNHRHIGERWWWVNYDGEAEDIFLFTENESNKERLWGMQNESPYMKDSINDYIIHGRTERVNPAQEGTKAAAHFQASIEPGGSFTVQLRFSDQNHDDPFADFDEVFERRIEEADEFYAAVHHPDMTAEQKTIQRQAYAGLMWTKQFYHYGIELWLDGDPAQPEPPESRKDGRNANWTHLYNLDVLSMPDKWEYPWYAAWDLAFHTLPIAHIDPEWAKRQLILLMREWYMHPNGQIPAYEWAFGDVNPPVHAWAVWRVYKITRNVTGTADTKFLERAFHKLLLNFTWWVNRKDADGNNVFQGGFLGLDNIGVFDRSAPLPTGGKIEQADGTAWMGMYCLNMLAMALELARTDIAYEDVATKFFEHFIYIADAIINLSGDGVALWDEDDGFFYDMLRLPDGRHFPMKIRSLVGLISLFAVETLEPDLLELLPRFKARMEWFIKHRPHLVENIASLTDPGEGERRLLSILNRSQLEKILRRMLDESEFYSPYGIRSLSRQHLNDPYELQVGDTVHTVQYEPAESRSGLFGGNSNWRGPIWFPLNYLMIESLQKYNHFYGDDLKVETPLHSGRFLSLDEVATDLGCRLNKIFLRDEDGRRSVFGGESLFQNDPHWQDYIPFYEYFHGDNGAGLGASHQTGWTALAARLLDLQAKKEGNG